ncbi:Ser-Thr-rich glycosyl-phosphatidyl-inositol-anchored membrane family protein [Symmachiella dynata]|uniref:hypothetical protein n=1 Tax=Symmachiella dynata TaxID=2527995 RepID=UPI00118C2AF0|nr:hypothetical protein [Symmachiella dynata]QDT50230.1 Ser-Thr-rich glycosyl-phosphatidyl-inositol-anchored membrane family protein [Symmachiella dynata]
MTSPVFFASKIAFLRAPRLHRWAAVVLALLCLGWEARLAPAAVPIPTRPIYTNQPRFRIPFRYDPAELKRMSATQILLYVSDDEGIKWRKSQAVAPTDGRFTFNAPGDGEYWFVVRTLSADGSLTPAQESIEPGLKVIVDTSAPQLYLTVRQSQPGWAQLTWKAVDTHLKPSSLTLHYKQGNSTKWKPLSFVPNTEGQMQWQIPSGGNIVVKGTVQDLAANTGKADMQTSIAPATDIVPRTNVPGLPKPVANKGRGSQSNTGLYIPKRFSETEEGSAQFKPVQQRSTPDPFEQSPSQQEGFVANTKPIGSRWHDDETTSPNKAQSDLPAVPFRFVNSREFNIGYKIDDIGPSGVSAVEVFVSQDNGDSWWKFGVDDDRKSPARVKVPKEGRYGLAMRVRSGVGLTSDPPQAGERPDMVIVVDITPPELRLLPLEQGQGVANNQILIQWDMEDQNLAEEPITLYYGGSAAGPWHPIAGAHRNTGRYLWKVGQGVPSKLYIRIQAQDAAGNTQTASTDYPVLVDLSRPRARIVDIEPDGSGQRQ